MMLTGLCGHSQKPASPVLKDSIQPIVPAYGEIDLALFGVDPEKNDNARYLQTALNYVVAHNDRYTILKVHSGRYRFSHSVLMYNWSVNGYWPFTVILQGENTYSSRDGAGTIFDFSSIHDSFGIGIQGGKGCIIRGIKLIGAWKPPSFTALGFYNTSFGQVPAGGCRNTRNSPHAAIVVDPFGPHIPKDGGYQGTDGFGNPWSSYYRGQTSGSTGIEIYEVFFANWLIGLITSPNGETFNAELLHAHHLQFQNVAYAVQGCQAEEKLNEVDHVECWGVTYLCFGTGMYGQGNPGNWHLHHWNIAGWVNTFAYNLQSGYFQSQFDHIYAENIGRLGYIASSNGTAFTESVFDFANYSDASYSYMNAQIAGQGVHYANDQFRYYGLYKPIAINNLNGPNFFENCYFDAVPVYNHEYPLGNCYFSYCDVGGTAQILNPPGPQEIAANQLSNTFCYGNRQVIIAGIGVLTTQCALAARELPIDLGQKKYELVTKPGSTHELATTIHCQGDECQRIRKGDVLLAYDERGLLAGIAGVVDAIDSVQKTCNIRYVPKEIISGKQYALEIWLPLVNIWFTGDISAGSNRITHVKLIAGDFSRFIQWGGLLQTRALPSSQDVYRSNLVRVLAWDAAHATLVLDRPVSATGTGVTFVNTDAKTEMLH